MSNKYVVIGTWTNPDQTKEWDLLAGPLDKDKADNAIVSIRENIPADATWLDHQEFIVSEEVYKLMLEQDEIDRVVRREVVFCNCGNPSGARHSYFDTDYPYIECADCSRVIVT